MQQLGEAAHAGDLLKIEIWQAENFLHRLDEADPLPMPDEPDGDVQRLTEHRGCQQPMQIPSAFFETQQVQPFGFGYDSDIEPLLSPFGDFSQLDGRIAVRFQWPALFTDNQHCGLFADAVGGRAAVLLGQVHRLSMCHRRECASEADSLTLQRGRTFQRRSSVGGRCFHGDLQHCEVQHGLSSKCLDHLCDQVQ